MDINQITSTILQQVGGITLGSVGARNFRNVVDEGRHGVAFQVGRGGKQCMITLDQGNDTYVVKHFTVRAGQVRMGETFTEVFCDQLSDLVWDSHLDKNKAA